MLLVTSGLWVPTAALSLAAQTAAPPPGTLRGVVQDAGGVPVGAAQVRLVELHRDHVSHEDGRFTFDRLPPGRYTLSVVRIGYRPHTRTLELGAGETVDVRVTLEAAAIQLAPRVVTGTLTERAGEDVLSVTSAVAGAKLESRLEATVAATVQGEAGLAMTSLGPATARPIIRGLGGDRILVLEDGQRPGDLSSMSSDHAVAIEPLTADRIEVVRGPMSLLYGSSALGGVVNVIRGEIPEAVPEHAHGVASLQGASVAPGGTVGGAITTRVGGLAARVEGSARAQGDVRTPVGTLENTDAQTYGAAAGVGLVRDWGHAGLVYRLYLNDYGIPGGFVGGHAQGVDIHMRRHTVRGELERHFHDRSFSRARVTGQFSDYYHTEREASGSIGTLFSQELASLDAVAMHDGWALFSQGAVGVRGQFRDVRTGGSLRTPSTYDFSAAIFGVEELGRGRTRGQVGLRYEFARYVPRDTAAYITVGGERVPVRPRNFGSVSGSIGVLHTVAPGLTAGVSVARAFRTPDFNELYSNGPHLAANSYNVGDPALKAESGLGADLFVRVSGQRLQVQAAVFVNYLTDYIFESSRGRADLGPQGGRPRFQYTNEDARFIGAEGAVTASLTPELAFDGSVSHVVARFTSTRDSIPVITSTDTSFVAPSLYPPLIPPLRGRVALRYERPVWFATAGLQAVHAQERLGDFETRTPGYAVGDLAVGIRLLSGGRLHTVTLRVDNVADRTYRDHLSRIKDIMPEPGRNVSLLYRLTF
jgi:iron complex outermembrane receptor protein